MPASCGKLCYRRLMGPAVVLGLAIFPGLAGVPAAAQRPEVTEAERQSLAETSAAAQLRRQGLQAFYQGQLLTALASLEQASQQYQAASEAGKQADAWVAIARTQAWLERPQQALSQAQQALAYYRDVGDPLGEAKTLTVLGLIHRTAGDGESAQQALEEAIESYRSLDTPTQAGIAQLELAVLQIQQEQYQAGLDRLNQGLALLDAAATPDDLARLEADFYRGYTYAWMGRVHIAQGQLDTAITHLEQAITIGHEITNPALQSTALIQLGNLFLDQGELDATVSHLRQAFAVTKRLENLPIKAKQQFRILQAYASTAQESAAQALAQLEDGDVAAAQAAARQAIDIAQPAIDQAQPVLKLADTLEWSDGMVLIHSAIALNYQAMGHGYHMLGRGYSAEGQLHADAEAQANALAAYQAGVSSAQAAVAVASDVDSQFQDLASGIAKQSRLNVAQAHGTLAQAYEALEQYDQAIQHWQQNLAISQQIDDPERQQQVLSGLANAYHSLGAQHQQAGHYEQALAAFQLGLAHAQTRAEAALSSGVDADWQQQTLFSLLYYGIAKTYADQYRYTEALAVYQQRLSVIRQTASPRQEFLGLIPIAEGHTRLSQYHEALAVEEAMVAIANQLDDAKLRLIALTSLASTHGDLGNYAEASAMYEQALPLARSQGSLSWESILFNNQGSIHTKLGDYDSALAAHNQALDLTRELRRRLDTLETAEQIDRLCSYVPLNEADDDDDSLSPDLVAQQQRLDTTLLEAKRQGCIELTWHLESTTLNNIALVYDSQGRYQDALTLYQKSLAIIRNRLNDKDGEAIALDNIATVYTNRGNYPQALEFHQQALTIRQDIGDREDIARSLNNIGQIYSERGQYLTALDTFNQALDLVEELQLRPLKSSVLNNLAGVYSSQGNYDRAEELYRDALKLDAAMGLKPKEANRLHNLGHLSFQRGQYTEAIDYAKQSLAIFQEIGERSNEATGLNNLGTYYRAQGNYTETLEAQQQALAIAQEIDNRKNTAYALVQLGNTYSALGQYDQALAYIQQALELFRIMGDRKGESGALSSQGNIYRQQDTPEQALQAYEHALAIDRAIGDVAGESYDLQRIGFVQERLGNYAAAESSFKQALEIQQRIGAQGRMATSWLGLGVIAAAQNQPEALDWLQQALLRYRDLGARPNQAQTLAEIGQILAQQEQPELAIVFLKEAVEVQESIRGQLGGLDPELQQSYTRTIADDYRLLADLLLQQNRIPEAQQVLDLLKVQELDEYFHDLQRNAQTAAGVNFWQVETDLLALYDQVLAQTAELERLTAIPPDARTSAQQQRLEELRTLRDQAEGWFYAFLDDPEVQATVNRIRSRTRGQNLEPDNLRDLVNNLQRLPQKTAVLYPLILEERLELVLVLPEGPPLRYPVAVSSAELNRAIVAFGQALKSPTSDIEPLAQQLYGWLMAPLAEQLQQAGIESIIYAPDGPLRYIPLAALHDGEQYVARRFSISHITAASLSDLNLQPQQQQRPLLAAACAECSFTVDVGEQTFTFSDLPATATEVQLLEQQMESVEVLLNQAFTPAIMEESTRYGIVHLATHAAFVNGAPTKSFILFGNGDIVNLQTIDRQWQLENTELVVLSACETAVGSTDLGSGIEILGLGYRLEQAGAQATLASLWKVSDGGTQVLMNAFYAALRQGLTKADALQQAQVALLTNDLDSLGIERGTIEIIGTATGRPIKRSSLSHPYYWAPFILIGNGL
ncbi:tetratricopeptide repeat domain protein [Halomicronema hongdechloris C2206]|uniref:Tetratricopeptide repeat domain protein n=1 Tax=Halomicronema hongdechloris C2206 TaxID=1641165 RepID=A0A1Z3HJF6_9CYAN|nr:tetratricopeptide repeat protein [Halomicronema hongdechloris]ASC70415.1 tetratricopeptide repeat domain protein [Halomicronema hongdechloris C2206]